MLQCATKELFFEKKKEVWNWIPSIEKTIKLPPSMMSQSWMGTDFTNDDLVKESSLVIDYTHAFSQDTLIDGRTCYTIVMLPKPEAAVVWGRLVICIDKERMVQLHARFYDEGNELINTMNAFDIKTMDGRLIPTRFEMIPSNKKNQKTVMIYESVTFNRPMDDSFFNRQDAVYHHPINRINTMWIVQLAWKNIWRNKSRTAITMAAVSLQPSFPCWPPV